jgi:signal transduction histidine kinase
VDDLTDQLEQTPVAWWLTALVVAVMLAGSLLLSTALRRAESDRIREAADREAESLDRMVEAQLRAAFDALLDLRAASGRWGPKTGEEWTSDAMIFVDSHPGFLGMLRLNPELGDVIAASPTTRASMRSVAARIQASEKLVDESLRGPLPLPDGRQVLTVELPVSYRDGGQRSVMVAVFDPQSALAKLLEETAPDYAIRLAVNSQTVLARGEPAGDPCCRHELDVEVPIGPPWKMEVEPTAELLAAQRSGLPAAVLGLGGILAAALGTIVHLGQLAGARARALARSNRGLLRRIESTDRAESEIRSLNEALETRVAVRTAELNEAVAELETFNSTVSHDLRSPLGAILNLSSILTEDYGDRLDDKGREYLTRIGASAQNAVTMMNGLVAFSHIGRGDVQKQPVELAPLFRAVFDELVSTAPPPAPSLEMKALPPAPGDAVLLRLVVLHLLSNAIKFSRGRPDPHILVEGASEGDELAYTVRDNGIGFDMRYADKLFRVFERLHRSGDFEGAGIGLAIVSRVISRHGGRVWAEGEPGGGAAFHFSLPMD